jgi:transcriptional regulator GlxA family with amidase domain
LSEGSFESDKYALIIASGMRLDKEKYPLSKAAITDAARWVKAQHQQGCAVAGACCAGGLILAEAGLLNGRMCATTWWLFHTFRERYPLAKPVWGERWWKTTISLPPAAAFMGGSGDTRCQLVRG